MRLKSSLLMAALMSQFPDNLNDEPRLAGGFRGKPVEVVKSETNDLMIPAHAEMVIEGEANGGMILDFADLKAQAREVFSRVQRMRRDAGYQLYRVQQGDEPSDWKPMPSIGPGVREIRVHV